MATFSVLRGYFLAADVVHACVILVGVRIIDVLCKIEKEGSD